MKVAVFGSLGTLPSLECATSLTAITGILAGKRTLVIDFDEDHRQIFHASDHAGNATLSRLVDKFIAERSFDSNDLRAQIIPVTPPASWGEWPGRQFDLIPGPATFSPAYLDRLAAQRGQSFGRMMITTFSDLNYELIVANLGGLVDTLCSEELVAVADLFVLRAEDPTVAQNRISARRRRYPMRPEIGLKLFMGGTIAFPDSQFVTALARSEYEESTARVSLDWAESEYLFPSIGSQLVDGQGRKIKPYRNILDRLFGVG
jgi:hypothetical protein